MTWLSRDMIHPLRWMQCSAQILHRFWLGLILERPHANRNCSAPIQQERPKRHDLAPQQARRTTWLVCRPALSSTTTPGTSALGRAPEEPNKSWQSQVRSIVKTHNYYSRPWGHWRRSRLSEAVQSLHVITMKHKKLLSDSARWPRPSSSCKGFLPAVHHEESFVVIATGRKMLNKNVVCAPRTGDMQCRSSRVQRRSTSEQEGVTHHQEWFAKTLHRVREPSLRHHVGGGGLKVVGMEGTRIDV